MNEKRYIVRKLVMAKDIKQAMKREREQTPDEVFLDLNYQEKCDANELQIKGFSE